MNKPNQTETCRYIEQGSIYQREPEGKPRAGGGVSEMGEGASCMGTDGNRTLGGEHAVGSTEVEIYTTNAIRWAVGAQRGGEAGTG